MIYATLKARSVLRQNAFPFPILVRDNVKPRLLLDKHFSLAKIENTKSGMAILYVLFCHKRFVYDALAFKSASW